MTAGATSSGGRWKYRFGLLLILAVVVIWVGSAEITQVSTVLCDPIATVQSYVGRPSLHVPLLLVLFSVLCIVKP